MDKELKSSYVQFDVASAINDWSDGVQGGDTCRIDALKDQFAWMRGHINGWFGWPNDGKAINIYEDIPTVNGFKKMRDIVPGDVLFDEKGNQCNVTAVTGIQMDKKCYRLTFSDFTTIECCEDHLWFTYNNSELRSLHTREKRIIKAPWRDQSYKRKQPQVRTTKLISETMEGRQKSRNNHSIPVSSPIQCDRKDLKIDPYVLGVWLGDGHKSGSRVTNHIQDYDIIKNIINSGYPCRRYPSDKDHTYTYGIGRKNQLLNGLRHYDLVKNKHIPSDFLFASYNQRLSLLQGLMDTDGYINRVGNCEYCTTIERFGFEVQALLASLGMKSSVNISDAKLYGRKTSTRYRIFFRPKVQVFILRRKGARLKIKRSRGQNFRQIIRCEMIDSIPVKCIQVDSPSRLYLASKSMIPTHNTEMRDFLKIVKAKYDGWKFGVFKPEDMDTVIIDGKPKIKANRIYLNLAWTLTGKTWDKNFAKRYFVPMMTMDELMEAMEFIQNHIYVIYPQDRRYKNVIDEFMFLHEKYGLDGIEIDTFSGLILPPADRGDERMVSCFWDWKEFALMTRTSVDFVSHAKSMNDVKDKGGAYKVVNANMQLGGAAWDMKMDGNFSIHRPERHLNPSDPKVHFYNLKQKNSHIVGTQRGVVEGIEFSWTKKQYFFNGVNPMDGSVKESVFEKVAKQEEKKKPKFTEDTLPF